MDVIAQKETIYVLNKTNSYFSDANLNTYLDMCYMSIYDDNGNIFSRAYYDSESNLINKNLYTFDDERLTSLSNYYDYDGLEILSYKNEYFYGEIILFSGVPDKIVLSLTKNMEGLYKLITIGGNSGGNNSVQ